jgi:hypothetical protein
LLTERCGSELEQHRSVGALVSGSLEGIHIPDIDSDRDNTAFEFLPQKIGGPIISSAMG